jgi:RNA polymerase sigma-70 factor (ECF subfamily)
LPIVHDLTALLMAARAGDPAAFEDFVRVAQTDVWRLAAHLVGTDAADDITQDTFVRAWHSLPRFRGDASARTWLLVIARRACVDAIRESSRHRRLWRRLTATAQDRSMPDHAGRLELDAIIRTIEPQRREAFVLTQVIGCSYAEAAEICDVEIGTIRSRVARARADMIEACRDEATG